MQVKLGDRSRNPLGEDESGSIGFRADAFTILIPPPKKQAAKMGAPTGMQGILSLQKDKVEKGRVASVYGGIITRLKPVRRPD